MRLASGRTATKEKANHPPRFGEVRQKGTEQTIVVPRLNSENRAYLQVGLAPPGMIISNRNFGLYDAPLWIMALIASHLHLVWIAAACGKLKTDYLFQHNELEHLSHPQTDDKEQTGSDPPRRGYPVGARGAFPRNYRRPLRPRKNARTPARYPQPQRRNHRPHLLSVAAFATTPSTWKNCFRCTPK